MRINNHDIYVERHGLEGNPAVVLLHHGLGSVNSWRAQLPELLGAGFQVIVYDRWGYGRSEGRVALSMPHFSEDIADLLAILDGFEIEQTALVGHSDGGTIALLLAAANPQRITSLVTIAAHIYIEPKMAPGIESIRETFQHDTRFREGLRRVHGDKMDAVFYGWYSGWTQPDHIDWDIRPCLSQIECPALVVQGAEDEHATTQHPASIAQGVPAAELWIVPGVGHMVPQEAPEFFTPRLLEFLGKTIASDGSSVPSSVIV